jgi:hypothetical protein
VDSAGRELFRFHQEAVFRSAENILAEFNLVVE